MQSILRSADLRVSSGFWCEDVHSNDWAAAVSISWHARERLQDARWVTGLPVLAGGLLAALARVFFNDVVSNEGVSHVI